jgi:CubicO group peptidase (beta-lactamase class C family)
MVSADARIEAVVPATPSGLRLREFLRAFNSGQEKKLVEFASRNYDPENAGKPGRAERVAGYWMTAVREYGPVVPISLLASGDHATEVWARGIHSEAWISLLLEVSSDPPHWVSGGGIGRGISPRVQNPVPAPPPAELPARLESYLEGLVRRDLFSGAVLVARGGEIVFEKAVGESSLEHRTVNTPNTRFNIASLSKMFAGVLIARLEEEGRLKFSDTLAKFIPEYPPSISDQVTIRRLLTHTSGIELDNDKEYADEAQRARSVPDLLAAELRHVGKLPGYPKFSPPDAFDYSNEGYDLLGAVAERVTGRPYAELLLEEIFSRAGMKDSGTFEIDRVIDGLAAGYTHRDGMTGAYLLGPPRTNILWLNSYSPPSGGHFSTVGDLFRFASALFGNRLLSPEGTRGVTTPQVARDASPSPTEHYGYGFEIRKKGSVTRIGHSGGLPGASARLDVYPELGYTVVVLANRDWVANNVADRVGELIGAGFSFEPSISRPAPARREGRPGTGEILFAQSSSREATAASPWSFSPN